MNNSDDHINPQITRALRQQADQIQEGPLTMADITGKARSIRRRRTLATVAGAAAVVAVIAPVGILALNKGDNNAVPPAASTGPTVATSTPSTPSTPSTGKIFTVDMTPSEDGTTNGVVMIPQWMDGTIADAHGNAVTVGQRVLGFVQDPSNGQWAGMTFKDGAYRWTGFDNSGAVLHSEPATSGSVAVTPDGQSFAWISKVAPDGAGAPAWTLTLAGRHAKAWPIGDAVAGAGVAGILSNDDVVYVVPEAGKVFVAHQDGSIDRLPGSYLNAPSVSTATDLVAVQTSANNDGTSCWALVDTSGDKKGQTCDYALGQFSADGRHIVGFDSQTDGLGPSRVHLLDSATLEPVATFDAPKDGYFWSATAWTGDTILADVFSHGEWGLAWLSADGIKMQRSANKPGDGIEPPPYLFGAGPLTALAP